MKKPDVSELCSEKQKPRLKSRKEITKALEGASGEYAEALRWVLGEAV